MPIIDPTDLKAWLGIVDNVDDTTLVFAVDAANRAVREWCGDLRIFDKTATESASARVYWPDDQCVLRVHDFWETSALQVKIDNADTGTYGTTWTITTDFVLEPSNAVADGEPYTRIRAISSYFPTWNKRPAVQVTAAWGWPSYPSPVVQATLIKAARLFKRKGSPEGVVGGFADFTAVRISNREDPDVVALLQPYRRVETAVKIA